MFVILTVGGVFLKTGPVSRVLGATQARSSLVAPAEATEIKIGIGAPLTDGAVTLGKGIERGAELAISEANESAEYQNLKIRFVGVPGDDRGDRETGARVASAFASDPDLVGVMGHLNSGVSITASRIYADKKIVMISPTSTNPALTQQGLTNVFRVCTTDAVLGVAAADYAANALGMKTAYVVDDSTPYGECLAAEFSRQFAANGGTVAGTTKTSDRDTDFSAVVARIESTNPDIIYYGGIYNAGALLAKGTREAGIRAPLMGGDGLYDTAFIELAGAGSAEGDVAMFAGLPPDELPAGQGFKAAFRKKYPEDDITMYDAYAYDATNVIISAVVAEIKANGSANVTAPSGRDAIIKRVASTNTTGVTGALAFDPNGDILNKTTTTYVVRNGAWVSNAR